MKSFSQKNDTSLFDMDFRSHLSDIFLFSQTYFHFPTAF